MVASKHSLTLTIQGRPFSLGDFKNLFNFLSLYSIILRNVSFNPLQPGVVYLYPPENIKKPYGLEGGIEKQHRVVMG